jgi:hypothetical protein
VRTPPTQPLHWHCSAKNVTVSCRYRQLLQDNGCSPALGVAIKEERKEAADMLANSPHKSKSKSPLKSPPTPPSSASKKSPKVKRELPLGQQSGQSAADSGFAAAAAPPAAARVKIEFDAAAAAHAPNDAQLPVSAVDSKRVKRERRS